MSERLDKLEAIGDANLRSALVYARSRARPVTADELAKAQGVHRNVARSRLERLAEAGLLISDYERRMGRAGPGAGRPAKTYAVAPELAALAFPEGRYEPLIGALLDAVPDDGGPERLRAVGAAYGEELARRSRLRPSKRLPAAFERMCEAVRRLGYQAAVEEVTEAGAVVTTLTCPLRPLVRIYSDAAVIDRGMWARLASRALGEADVRIECKTEDCLEDRARCSVRINLS